MATRYPNVAWQFFRSFARFENALKREGYLKSKEIAEADWDMFARELDQSSFFDKVRNAPEAMMLVCAPPKKRTAQGMRLGWQDGQPVTDTVSLFNAIRRARNNLYHGEKFIGDPASDERAEQLLREALWVLELALLQHEKIKTAFDLGEAAFD